jgi:hypothetical protein
MTFHSFEIGFVLGLAAGIALAYFWSALKAKADAEIAAVKAKAIADVGTIEADVKAKL